MAPSLIFHVPCKMRFAVDLKPNSIDSDYLSHSAVYLFRSPLPPAEKKKKRIYGPPKSTTIIIIFTLDLDWTFCLLWLDPYDCQASQPGYVRQRRHCAEPLNFFRPGLGLIEDLDLAGSLTRRREQVDKEQFFEAI